MCTSIIGTDALTFTKDEGATLAPTTGVLQGVGYTALAALDTPNTLLAAHKGALLRSDDAGCTWTSIGTLDGDIFQLTAGKGGRAYAWVDNGETLYRIENGVPTKLVSPVPFVIGLGVDPADGLHLRIGDTDGAIHESMDGGATWAIKGVPASNGGSIGYRVAFDPKNLDHILYGQSTEGSSVTTDGAATWTKSGGLGASANAFSIVISPADSDRVWVEGIEIGPDQRHVYVSSDGGLTFTSKLTEGPTIDLINGNLLFAHPTNKDVLYFVFGTYFQNFGTDLYRYDLATDTLSKKHNGYDELSAIVASPADPSVLYLGLTVEEVNLQ
jgi:hypothetical protein